MSRTKSLAVPLPDTLFAMPLVIEGPFPEDLIPSLPHLSGDSSLAPRPGRASLSVWKNVAQ